MPEQAIELNELWMKLGALNWDDDAAKQIRNEIKRRFGVTSWAAVLEHADRQAFGVAQLDEYGNLPAPPKVDPASIELSREVEDEIKRAVGHWALADVAKGHKEPLLREFARRIIAQVREEMQDGR